MRRALTYLFFAPFFVAIAIGVMAAAPQGATYDEVPGGGNLPLSGGTMTGDLNMGSSDLICDDADATGDTKIVCDTDDEISIEINGAEDFLFSANKFLVQAGSSIWRADNALDYWGTGGDATIKYDGSNLLIDCNAVGTGTCNFQSGTKYTIPTTITVAANAATVDLNASDLSTLDLQGSSAAVTVTLSNAVSGSWALKIIQGSNLDTITWPAAVKWSGGVAPVITATNDAVDIVSCVCDGTNHYCAITQDVK